MQRQEGLCVSFILLVVLGLAVSSAAQTETATLSGRVTDPSGAIVPGARVEVINIATNITTTTETNAQGIYVVPNLRPGRYRIMVRKEGFKQVVKPGVVLNVQDIISHNFALEVGSVVQSVTVLAESGHMSTSPAVGTVVDRQFVENLPLNGRSFQTLIMLTPGVVLAKTAPGLGQEGQFSVNGQRADANYFTVDGVSANVGVNESSGLFTQGGGSRPAFSVSGGTNTLVSVDALEEFKIQTSTYAPEFGRQPGGQVSMLTRSGTNGFHGTVFEYFRNDKLDANDWFANQQGLPKPELRQNDFGFVIGGPIIKDRTFFFFSYEGLRLRLPRTAISSTPSITTRLAASAATRPYLDAFPLPTGSDLGNGAAELAGSFSDPSELDATSIRIDHTVNNKLTLFARYNNAPSDTGTRLSNRLSTVTTTEQKLDILTGGATLAISPSISNELRVNWSRTRASILSALDDFGGAVPLDESLFVPPFATREDSLFVLLTFVPSLFLLEGRSANNLQRQINIVDNLSITKGSHQLKVGIDYRRLFPKFNQARHALVYGFFNVNDIAAGNAFLLQQLGGDNPIFPLFTNFSAFAQDTWRIMPRLTLTYGLRWEYNPPPSEKNGKSPLAVIGLGDPATMTLGPPRSPFWKKTYDNFAPRVGVAYQLSENNRFGTVLRSGFGLFYDVGNSSGAAAFGVYPFTASTVQLFVPFPDFSSLQPVDLPANPLVPPFGRVFDSDPNLKLPRTYQWNVSVEQSLGTQQTLTASYVGAAGRKLLRVTSLNTPNPDFTSVVDIQESVATSDYHSLQVQFKRRLSRGLQALASYTWSHSIDTGSFNFSFNAPPAAVPLEQDRASSAFDIRHSFQAAITYDILKGSANSVVGAILGNWSVDTIITAQTPTPVNVMAGTDPLGLGLGGTTNPSRPDLVPGVPLYLDDPSVAGGRRFNRAAYDTNFSGRQGTLGRNTLRGFDLSQVNFALRRRIPLTERVSLQFRAEFFNLFNHPNFGNPPGRLTDPFFGESTQMFGRSLSGGIVGLSAGFNPLYQIGGPRSIQLALKLQF